LEGGGINDGYAGLSKFLAFFYNARCKQRPTLDSRTLRTVIGALEKQVFQSKARTRRPPVWSSGSGNGRSQSRHQIVKDRTRKSY
jgi:hypothetical protein